MDGPLKLIEALKDFEPLALAILFLGLTALAAIWLVAKVVTRR